jgi:5-methyltetrahydropteroyltriglutamate--homocysteine methyltransferase
MSIPTEPIGSVPRPRELLDAQTRFATGAIDRAALAAVQERALRETIAALEGTGSPVITDGEQTKPSFATYPLEGLDLAADGVEIRFEDGHVRQLPRLVSGPFRYGVHAESYVRATRRIATRPVKQAVISASALSLVYPQGGLPGYDRDAFLDDLVGEAVADIRGCLDAGADSVQVDFTEGRLAGKLDPSGGVLREFVDLNNRVLERFGDDERARIGVHTCPGGDQDSTHSADVDYALLLPDLFRLRAGRFYIQLASEPDRSRVLALIRDHAPPHARIFVGVIDPIDPVIETAEQVRDRVLEAAELIPLDRLGTTDDCGFSPFGDDVSTARETAFRKVQARVRGTALAAAVLGVSP